MEVIVLLLQGVGLQRVAMMRGYSVDSQNDQAERYSMLPADPDPRRRPPPLLLQR